MKGIYYSKYLKSATQKAIIMPMEKCLLCQQTQVKLFYNKTKTYWRCKNCQFIFLDPDHRISLAEEKIIYDFHENNPDDENYLKFLSSMTEPLKTTLNQSHRKALDYGCGPGPAMDRLLEHLDVSHYDPLYFPEQTTLTECYDVITCTEAAEHFFEPALEFEKLISLLNPNGRLAVMTERYNDSIDFNNWYYKNDPTHVCFYSDETLNWIANRYQLELKLISHRCAIFCKAP